MTSDQGPAAGWRGEGRQTGRQKAGPVWFARERGRTHALSVSGSDQAREGRLVDALAARGDEGRDTLR